MRGLHEKPRWHLIYYLLGFIDIVAICISLFLNNVITEKYQDAVTTNEYWSKVRLQLRFVEIAASKVVAPGNDVFESKDIAKEREKFVSAVPVFKKRFEELKASIVLRVDLDKSFSVSEKFERIEDNMREIKLAVESIFTNSSDGSFERAAIFMAKLDREHMALHEITNDLAIRFTEIQDSSLSEEEKIIEQLRLVDHLTALFVIIMVLGIVIYGRKISKFITNTTDEISESKNLYEAIVLASSQLIWNIDDHGRFKKDHGSWYAFTGLTPELAADDGWFKAMAPDEQESVKASIVAGMAKKTTF